MITTMQNEAQAQQQQKKMKKTLWMLGGFTILMFGFAFALVPFYSVVCKAIGLNGKTNNLPAQAATVAGIDKTREIKVIFLATNNEKLPWEFKPMQTTITLHPGEDKRVAYYAKNNSGKRMTVQAVPSVTPGLAAKYIQKTECFCFTQQTFDPDQRQEMPLIFRLDQSIPKEVNTVVLSYTLFDAGKFIGKTLSDHPGRIS